MPLSEWSDIINRQGEERRRREEEQTQRMLDELPTRLSEVTTLSNVDLLDRYLQYVGKSWTSYATPRKQTAMFRLLRRNCRVELLRRLGR